MKDSPKTFFIILILFTLLTLLIFWPIFLGKVNLNGHLLVSFYQIYGQNLPYKPTGWDQLRIYYPFYRVTLESLRNFAFPLWNPYAFSGHPHLADFQTAVFYPLNVFGFFLSQIEFWHLLRITPMILASFFTFLYLKNLKLSKLAAFFGAMTFGFSPFILTWGEEVVMAPHSIVWLPLVLFSVDKYLGNRHKKYLAIISLSTAFSLFGGYMQTTIYLFIFAFAYMVFRFWTRPFHLGGVLRILTAFVLGILLAEVQLLPSAELYFNSARASVTLRETLFQFLLPLTSLLTFLAPDFFGPPATANFIRGGSAQYYEGIIFIGIAALIFGTYSIFLKSKLVKFLAIFGLISLSLTINLPTSKLFLSLPIPFLSTSIANRILFIPAFCLSVLAAIGMERWLSSKDKKILKVILSLGVVYILLASYLLAARFWHFPYFKPPTLETWQAAMVSLRNLAVPFAVFVISGTMILVATFKNKYKYTASLVIITLAFLHIFYFTNKYYSFSERKYIFPKTPVLDFIAKNQEYFRSWGLESAFLENNFASFYSIFWPGGYDSLNNRSYGEFTFSGKGVNLDDFSFRADAGLGGKDQIDEFFRPDKRKIADIIGVRFVVAKQTASQKLAKNNFREVFKDADLAVFENLQVAPRVFLASNYEGPPQVAGMEGQRNEKIEKARRKLIPQKLFADDFDFRNVLILEKPSPVSPQFGEGGAEILSYKPQEVIIKTNSSQTKLLFLSDNYYPGWKATVNGEETEILRANYTFRAVPLVPGEHLVRFYYDSEVFKAGLFISLASLAVLGFLMLRRNPLSDG